MLLYHGTTSAKADAIKACGFLHGSYFTTLLAEAEYYAATGGEDSLQLREEAYEEATGLNAREEYAPDFWDMFRKLYPAGETPVVLVLQGIPASIMSKGRPDAGAVGGLVFDCAVPACYVENSLAVIWPT